MSCPFSFPGAILFNIAASDTQHAENSDTRSKQEVPWKRKWMAQELVTRSYWYLCFAFFCWLIHWCRVQHMASFWGISGGICFGTSSWGLKDDAQLPCLPEMGNGAIYFHDSWFMVHICLFLYFCIHTFQLLPPTFWIMWQDRTKKAISSCDALIFTAGSEILIPWRRIGFPGYVCQK